jgi:diaminopimelate epimerase
MKLSVMAGTGNVFAMADGFAGEVPRDPAALVRALCADRSRRPTLDGLLLITRPSAGGDCRMIVYNADGSRPESCGNGLRCVARAVVERGHVRGDDVRIETDSGTRRARVTRGTDGTIDGARVTMGVPRIESADTRLRTSWGSVQATVVVVGNPHCVVFVDDERTAPLATQGPELERHPAFPQRTNVELVALRDGRLHMRVWERGVGETAACGTGACAAAVAAARAGTIALPVEVVLPGGTLRVAQDADGEVVLSGPCAELGALDAPAPPAQALEILVPHALAAGEVGRRLARAAKEHAVELAPAANGLSGTLQKSAPLIGVVRASYEIRGDDVLLRVLERPRLLPEGTLRRALERELARLLEA